MQTHFRHVQFDMHFKHSSFYKLVVYDMSLYTNCTLRGKANWLSQSFFSSLSLSKLNFNPNLLKKFRDEMSDRGSCPNFMHTFFKIKIN
jgi:hypothetical protein